MASAGPANPKYFLNTRKQFKMWFSRDPNEFMGLVNQQRLEKWCKDNPEASRTLIYCSALLNRTAQADLKSFCERLFIQPVDIAEFKKVKKPNEKKIFELGMRELTVDGGDLAAASDCFRILAPVLQKCGIYSDCDVKLNLSAKPPRIALAAPLTFEASVKILDNEYRKLLSNNEFLGAATQEDGSLHQDAVNALNELQSIIIKNYRTHPSDFVVSNATIHNNSVAIKAFAAKFRKSHSSGDIVDFRAYAKRELGPDAKQKLLEDIWRISVINCTGPVAYNRYLMNADFDPLCFSLSVNDLMECIASPGNAENPNAEECANDLSWLPSGQVKMRERDKELLVKFESERRAGETPEAAACMPSEEVDTANKLQNLRIT